MKKLVDYFGFGKKSAELAKDRLHIIIAQSRSEKNTSPDFLPLLRKDILDAIAKYTKIDLDKVHVELLCKDNNSVLELNITLPDVSKTESREHA